MSAVLQGEQVDTAAIIKEAEAAVSENPHTYRVFSLNEEPVVASEVIEALRIAHDMAQRLGRGQVVNRAGLVLATYLRRSDGTVFLT